MKLSQGWQARRNHTTLPWSVVFFLIPLLLLTACLSETPSPTPILPTETQTVTPTTTATIVWFPPTATFTPAPTHIVQPTQDLRPQHGATILEDAFTDRTQWATRKSEAGSVAYGNGELTLAVSQPGGLLTSLRNGPQVDNFYMEIDATPSLCRGKDQYGLMLRAMNYQNFYRLMVNCNGELRMERYRNAYTAPLLDWVGSGELFPGEMSSTRLGVWAVGSEMRIYIDGVFQFSVKDPVFNIGTIGVFARSAGDTPLTVSFSNLMIYRVDASQARPLPTASLVPSATPKPTSTRRPTPTTAK